MWSRFIIPRTWWFGLAAMGMLAGPVLAGAQDLPRRIEACAKIEDPAERLACFDRIARSLGIDGAGSAADSLGQWGVNRQAALLDEGPTTTLYLPAASTRPPLDEEPFLFVRCRGGELKVYVTWSREVANGEVQLRLDEGPTERQYWDLSTDREAVLQAGDARAFLDDLRRSRRLVVKANLKNGVPTAAVFELDGLSRAATAFGRDCAP